MLLYKLFFFRAWNRLSCNAVWPLEIKWKPLNMVLVFGLGEQIYKVPIIFFKYWICSLSEYFCQSFYVINLTKWTPIRWKIHGLKYIIKTNWNFISFEKSFLIQGKKQKLFHPSSCLILLYFFYPYELVWTFETYVT